MTGLSRSLLYVLFAALATLANLFAQRMVLHFWVGPFALLGAIAIGTIAGLVLKFGLDRRWIFGVRASHSWNSAAEFVRYTGTGVFTTCVFWGTESVAWIWFGTNQARELGAIVGLSIGYFVKYKLDKKYVFRAVS